jgi:hypothetical protein
VICVGAPDDASSAGAVYIFKVVSGTWTEQQKITPTDPGQDKFFGESIALDATGSTIVISATGDATMGVDAGAIYTFTLQSGSYVEEGKMTAWDGSAGIYFGSAIAMTPDASTLVVGAESGNGTVTGSGVVYTFTRGSGTWTNGSKLEPSAGKLNGYFGGSVSLSDSGRVLAVGAESMDGGNTEEGKVYLFEFSGNTWSEVSTLTVTAPAAFDYFGGTVSLSADGSVLLASCTGRDTLSTDAGSAYIFN